LFIDQPLADDLVPTSL